MKSGCPLTLSCLAALLCLNLPLQAQVGDYPPPRGKTSWQNPIEDYWKELKGHDVKDCVAASDQPAQSPLDLKGWTEDTSLAAIRVSYDDGWNFHVEMERNAHTIEFHIIGGARKVTIGGVDYRLLRFHFHHPSEHLINGERKAMEMHLVHQAADGKLAVLAVRLQGEDIATSNWPFSPYNTLWRTMTEFESKAWRTLEPRTFVPRPDGTARSTADMENFVLPPPGQRGYITYTGSLTTPGCGGNVTWVVFTTPIPVPWSRVEAYKALYPTNARWPQDLGTRQLKSKGKLE